MTKRLYLFCIFCVHALMSAAQSSADIQRYIDQYKEIALEQERKYGVPASITLAQGILESGAGRSGLARNANNHFGIKTYGGWSGPEYCAWDDEAQKSRFRVYGSAAESYQDHSEFLCNNSRYHSLFSKSVFDYRGWAYGLQLAGYATSPTYAKALIGYIDSYRLYAINGGVKLNAGKTVVIRRTITLEELIEDEQLQMDDDEKSEEEEAVEEIVRRLVVEINDLPCTLIYPGETLASVALRYDIPKSDLLEFNEASSEQSFHEGDVVFLDKKKKKYAGAQDYYLVREGDTLYGISQRFGIRLSSLCRMNGKNVFTALEPGERLRLK